MILKSFDFLLIAMLFVTFIYCMVIDRRLRVLKSQEGALRKVVQELSTATESAREATTQLRLTSDETQRRHWDQVEAAQVLHEKLASRIDAATTLVGRLPAAVSAGEGTDPLRPVAVSVPSDVKYARKSSLPSIKELARNVRLNKGAGFR